MKGFRPNEEMYLKDGCDIVNAIIESADISTEDGKHHGCKLDRFTDLFSSDKSWKLTCPDGFVQHNGNYYIEKN